MNVTTATPDALDERRAAPAPPADAASNASNWWSDTLVYAGRNIEHIRQIPEKLLDVTIQPLMFVLLFAYVFGGAIHVGGNYREYIIAGILIQSLSFGMTGPAAAKKWFRSTPRSIWCREWRYTRSAVTAKLSSNWC